MENAAIDLFKIFSLSFVHLLNLPCHVFWKNSRGVYLGYNDFGALDLGFASGEDIVGKTDFDLFPHEIATVYKEHDQEVIKQNKQMLIPEKRALKDNTQVVSLSYKMPIYNHLTQSVTGLLGLVFVRPLEGVASDVFKKHLLSVVASAIECDSLLALPSCQVLSPREEACAACLCLGLTTKEVAKKLQVSPRTVETYIERSKFKLNCHNKAELIVAFLKNHGDI